MNLRKTSNDIKISNYLNQKRKANKSVPYMTSISKELGVSIATISRYAKRSGFYSFPNMRATLNKDLEGKKESSFVEWLKQSKKDKIVLVTSLETEILGSLLLNRLKELRFNIRIISSNILKQMETMEKKSSVLLISFGNNSKRVKIASGIAKKGFHISVKEIDKKNSKLNYIILKEIENGNIIKSNINKNPFVKNRIIRKMFEWIDDNLNSLDGYYRKG